MTTPLISNTKTKSLPKFPELTTGKTSRLVTKHFTNLPLWLSFDEVAFMNWLVYQIKANNTFRYSTRLLNQYCSSIRAGREQYGVMYYEVKITANIINSRKTLEGLIEKGLILPTSRKNNLMVNPMLTYEPSILSRKKYTIICSKYQDLSPENIIEFTDTMTKLVGLFLESKKKNYKYGKQ